MSEWGPQNFPTSLVELWLNGENSGVVSFAVAVAEDVNKTTTPSSSFLLPPSLVSLELKYFKDVESFSEPIKFDNKGVEVEKVKVGARLSTPCKRSDWFQNLG
ncbi:hypothetical protein L1887_18124 [Cichorium endivia]|nr:hypothetical protein L1887_18124 [Cichorium endivia]